MPLISLKVSEMLPENKKKDLLYEVSKLASKAMGKPESYVMVTVEHAAFSIGGKNPSAAFVDVRGIGGIGGAINKAISKDICGILARDIGIKPEHVYLNFTNVAAENWGCNGTTFG